MTTQRKAILAAVKKAFDVSSSFSTASLGFQAHTFMEQ